MPLSPTTHLRVLRALASSAAEVSDVFVALLARPRLDLHEVLAICDAGQRVPELIVTLLLRPVQPWTIFPDEASDLIGSAALRSPEVRDALLERWARERAVPLRVFGSYPGDALAPLVQMGDAEAEDVYTEWLPHSYIGMIVQRARTGVGAAQRPRVDSVARKAALDLWAWGKPHANAKGETEQGHPRTVGAGLRHWWPAWLDTPVVEELWSWLEGADAERAGAAADALLAGPLPEPWATRLPGPLATLIARLLGSRDFIDRGVLCAVLRGLWDRPEALALVDALKSVADASKGEIHLVAAAVLLPHVSEREARALSESAAQGWPPEFFLHGRVDELLGPLIEANPDAWTERARGLAAASGLYAAGHIEQLMRVAPQVMAHRLDGIIGELERACPAVPWIARSDRLLDLARPADVSQRLRYLHGRSALPREGSGG